MRRRTWKDELATLLIATGAQFLLLRAADWARANQETQPIAARLVENRFYFLPQILVVLLLYLVVRLVRSVLDFRGIRFGDWLRSSAVLVGFSAAFIPAAHLDQVIGFAAGGLGIDGLVPAAQSLAATPFYDLLRKNGTLRLVLDLVGFAVFLAALRFNRAVSADEVAARDAWRLGDFVRAGDLCLKAGNVRKAKQMFTKGKAWARLAALEERDGDEKSAAELYEKAGDAFSWEASRAWEAAGEPEQARALAEKAVAVARAGGRWDRLAEIAESTGDQGTLAEACRRLAEAPPTGPVRAALWKRTAEAARAAGRPLEAAEAYRFAQDFAMAGEMYLEGARPLEAVREFERSGALQRAAVAAAKAGDERTAQELNARGAESRGDLSGAADAWRKAGQVLRSAALFERLGEYSRAAEAWTEADRTEKAAPLWEKAGDPARAAAAWEAAGQPERAASLWAQLQQYERAAALYRTAGKLHLSAAALQSSGKFEEAAKLFGRVGRGLDAVRCLLAGGRRDRAWEELVSVPRGDPGVAEAFHELANAHLDAGEPRDAVHVLRELLGRSPVTAANITYYRTLLRALRDAKDPSEAVDRAFVAAFDPAVLEGSPVVAAAAGAGEVQLDAIMPPALMKTPPAVARTGSRRIPVHPSGSTIPVVAAPPPGPSLPPPSASSIAPEKPEERYEIVAELGRGGMGVVHKALDRKLDRFIALKILPWQLRTDETAMRYFTREAKAIAALRHPNVVALYDYGEGFGSLYLAMEYLEGPNLQKLLKTDSERVHRNWREWFVQSARGIAAAHAKGILHRDLKPANLQLDEHDILRILDFGLALPQADAGGTSKLIGSPAFFPPEVLRGELPSPASDVYSLGAAFYTLATGRWPYVGDDVLVARLERDPDDPRPFAPFLTEAEVHVLMTSLARFRPDRYPDGGELLGALLAIES